MPSKILASLLTETDQLNRKTHY